MAHQTSILTVEVLLSLKKIRKVIHCAMYLQFQCSLGYSPLQMTVLKKTVHGTRNPAVTGRRLQEMLCHRLFSRPVTWQPNIKNQFVRHLAMILRKT